LYKYCFVDGCSILPVKVQYICVFMTCSTSYCHFATLTDPWNECMYVYMYVRMYVQYVCSVFAFMIRI